MPARAVPLFACLIAFCASARGGGTSASSFDETVAPVLIRRCLECHSGLEPAGKLDLSRRETMLAGGESGPALVPADAEKSLLWQRVAAGEMPPKKPSLSSAEKTALRDWIAARRRLGSRIARSVPLHDRAAGRLRLVGLAAAGRP